MHQHMKFITLSIFLLLGTIIINAGPVDRQNYIQDIPGQTVSTQTFSLYRSDSMKQLAVKELYKTHGLNEDVLTRINEFTKFRRSFRNTLFRSGSYIQKMTDILIEKGLPPELVYLPFIESGYRTNAYSHKNAAGPWQLMPVTADTLGLKMDWWVDERRDPIKSTKAAARYLKYLYRKFGSWNLALAAYNAGEGRINRVLRKVRTKDFWAISRTRHLTDETKNYVPSYIAAAAIAIDPENYGFRDIVYRDTIKYDTVVIEQPMDLEVVAELTGSTVSIIKDLNPELRRWCTPPNVSLYVLRIPGGAKNTFMANLYRISDAESYFVKYYHVQSGDTVAKIAQKLGVPVQKIIRMNDLGKRALIYAGKKLVVPLQKDIYKTVFKT